MTDKPMGTEETWKDIKGYEGLYKVSDRGRIYSIKRKLYRKFKTDKNGYLVVNLSKNSKYDYPSVHRLVAMAFIPNPDNLPEVNHKDENKFNNSVDNLEWCTTEYNLKYGTRLKRVSDKLSKPIEQWSKDGQLIKVWASLIEVEKETGWSHGNISRCANGLSKTAYGFIWKYQIPLNVP